MNLDVSKKYALAVSGGIDSMVMLDKFARNVPKLDFYVVTVDHKIRKEGKDDCAFVEKYCGALGIECKRFTADVPSYCQSHKLSEETGARILRYGVLSKLECDYVCLAHHLSDSAETVVMHLIRGSGAYGAEGIRFQSGKYLRPLLDLTRQDISEYALKYGIPFVHDRTNDDDRYARNFVRHEVMPKLIKLNKNAERNIARFAENIACDNEFLDSLADISAVKFDGRGAEIPVNSLLAHRSVAYRLLRKVFARLEIVCDIEKVHYDSLIALASMAGGKKLCLPFDLTAVNDYNKITIFKNSAAKQIETFELAFRVGTTDTPVGSVIVSKDFLPNALRFDAQRVPDSALLRTRREGDVFTKFGGGTKSLKKYLIDKKISGRKRDGLLVIADGSDVLLIVGLEISDKLKVTENSDTYYIKLT